MYYFFLGVYIYISICICIYVYIYIPPFVTHTHTHIFVYTDVPDTLSSFLDGHTTSAEASDSLVQAWVAHEAVYLALMGHFTKLIDYMAPWVENERLFWNGGVFMTKWFWIHVWLRNLKLEVLCGWFNWKKGGSGAKVSVDLQLE